MEFEDVKSHFENNHRGVITTFQADGAGHSSICLLYTSPSPRDATLSRMPSSA